VPSWRLRDLQRDFLVIGLAGVTAAILLVLRLVIAGTFIRAGAAKLPDRREFRLAIENYQILPASLVPAAAVTVPAVEITVGLLFLLGVFPAESAAVLAAVLLCFSAAIAVNLARGRVFDCGCDSSVAPQAISWRHVVVNTIFAAGAIAIAVAPPVGLDLLRGPGGLVSITVPGGSVVPLVLAATLSLVLTRVLGAATTARRAALEPSQAADPAVPS
jgi:uncharacterized membrane protein YphA (DoxX/SURF4 family)